MTVQVDILIKNATILTVDKDRRVITDGAIVIEKDKIKDIGKSNELSKMYSATKVIDGTDRLVMPGLVNSHIHFYHHMHKGLSPENFEGLRWSNWVHSNIATVVNKEDEIWGGLAVLIETLRSGTTSVLEAGSYNPEDVIEGVAELGMRAVIGRRVFDQVALGHSSLVQSTEQCLKLNEKFVSKYKGGLADGRVTPHVNIVGAGRCTDRLIVESKKMADHYGVVLNLHLAASIWGLYDNLQRTGMRPVEQLYNLGVLGPNVVLVHMVHVSDQEIQMLKEHGVNVCYCPATALKLAYGLSIAGRFPEMLNAGVNVAIGTDTSDCANFEDMIRVMYLAAVLFKDFRGDANVMGAETAIEMATINGARALGMENEIGSLEKGKKADVVIVNMRGAEWIPLYNPIQNLVYSSSGNSVQTVIIDGRVVMEDWEIKTVDEEKVLAKCQELSEGILKRSRVNRFQTLRWNVM